MKLDMKLVTDRALSPDSPPLSLDTLQSDSLVLRVSFHVYRRGVWYLYAMTVSQLVIAALVGGLSAVAWAQSSSGELFLLVVSTFSVQLVSAAWSASGTANDRIDAAEKTIVHLSSWIKPCPA